MQHNTQYHLQDKQAFEQFRQRMAQSHPNLHWGVLSLCEKETLLTPDYGGIKFCWIFEGSAEILLPKGIRTKEGDGVPLPDSYLPDPIASPLREGLDRLEEKLSFIHKDAQSLFLSILSRRKGACYVGDYANDLWKLAHLPCPWTVDPFLQKTAESLFEMALESGYSTKQHDSWEPIMPGDQVCVGVGEQLPVRGTVTCLTLEHKGRSARPISPIMRLRYLRDSAGGCNFDFDPFRRLPLTWYMHAVDARGDGINMVNSHVVNIAQETSPTHFHPRQDHEGGLPQFEIYLVLDPRHYSLKTYGRKASLITFPDLMDLGQYAEQTLSPGSLVCIPPGVGHRGMDVFTNVITLPGFKPHHEFYIDQDIYAVTKGSVPCNESLFEIKNYAHLQDIY